MLGGLDYHSIAMAVRRALGTVGTTMGSLTVTGNVSVGGSVTAANYALTSQALVAGATVTWNAASGGLATWTIGGNRTLSNPTNLKAGAWYILQITQDGTGGRVVTWESAYKGVNGGTAPQQPNPTAGAVTAYYFYSADGTSLALVAPAVPAFGQCQLTKSGANLLLSPYNGNPLTINGKVEVIPDAGVSLAPPAVASTTYYIYAYMNAGVMTLEQSATAPATQAVTGVKIKTTDATRTLVGMARTTAANAWVDTATQRFVLSYFNRRNKSGRNTVIGSTASGTFVELNSSARFEFLTWGDEDVVLAGFGSFASTATAGTLTMALGVDGTVAEVTLVQASVGVSPDSTGLAVVPMSSALAEGYHYATLLLKTDTTFAGAILGGAAVSGMVRG